MQEFKLIKEIFKEKKEKKKWLIRPNCPNQLTTAHPARAPTGQKVATTGGSALSVARPRTRQICVRCLGPPSQRLPPLTAHPLTGGPGVQSDVTVRCRDSTASA
jgi:hypothetical protein